MKAERRHELQENTLAHVLQNFPLYLSIYSGRILTVLLILSLGFFLLRYRANVKREQFQSIRENLATAREYPETIARFAPGFAPPAQLAQQRSQTLAEADAVLDAVQSGADSDTLRAEAHVARGDVYWAAANLGELPGAATQPALALPQPREQLLAKAEAEYQTVVSNYSREVLSRVAAQFGLAAIAENRGKFEDAERIYTQIADASDTPSTYAEMAKMRKSMIPTIRVPRQVAIATQPAIQTPVGVLAPADGIEAATQPVEPPATAPTTQPG
jgi:tetratricopeptide (TPR) repeat protein